MCRCYLACRPTSTVPGSGRCTPCTSLCDCWPPAPTWRCPGGSYPERGKSWRRHALRGPWVSDRVPCVVLSLMTSVAYTDFCDHDTAGFIFIHGAGCCEVQANVAVDLSWIVACKGLVALCPVAASLIRLARTPPHPYLPSLHRPCSHVRAGQVGGDGAGGPGAATGSGRHGAKHNKCEKASVHDMMT